MDGVPMRQRACTRDVPTAGLISRKTTLYGEGDTVRAYPVLLTRVHYDQLPIYNREMAMRSDVLSEIHPACRRRQLLKLLAEEEAKDPSAPQKGGEKSPQDIS
jgi:hypothetical protein